MHIDPILDPSIRCCIEVCSVEQWFAEEHGDACLFNVA